VDTINELWNELTSNGYQVDVGVTYRDAGRIDAAWTTQPSVTRQRQRPTDQNNPRYEQRSRSHSYTLLGPGLSRHNVTIIAAPAVVKLTA